MKKVVRISLGVLLAFGIFVAMGFAMFACAQGPQSPDWDGSVTQKFCEILELLPSVKDGRVTFILMVLVAVSISYYVLKSLGKSTSALRQPITV